MHGVNSQNFRYSRFPWLGAPFPCIADDQVREHKRASALAHAAGVRGFKYLGAHRIPLEGGSTVNLQSQPSKPPLFTISVARSAVFVHCTRPGLGTQKSFCTSTCGRSAGLQASGCSLDTSRWWFNRKFTDLTRKTSAIHDFRYSERRCHGHIVL